MARQPRLTLPGYPHHIIQRGNNRQPIVLDDEDRQCLLDGIRTQAQAARVAVHGYVLMSNHLHLLATPETGEGVPTMMQAFGRSYVRQFNRRHNRSGTLFEGRYRSTLIEAERYLLACMVYIDLNPVRVGMVAQPEDYPWSSYAHHAGLRQDDGLTTPHPLYWALGNTPFARQAAYADLVHAGLSNEQRTQIGQTTHSGWALGTADFVADLQARTERRVARGRAGRPISKQKSD
ncbi:REP-associated tyrosine transposase [Ottowia sp.]|uniref:REP-associated tyrosine transposase n=1 Tax=Ottowia sp. TaxID=1898956 RepID=UPI003A881385